MPRAAIDIGSNSLLLTVVSDEGAILHDEARVVGLGKGLGDRGLFAPDRIAAASEVLADYVATARAHGVDPLSIKAVATSAARRAMNAETVFERFHRAHGLRVRIIPGEEEALLTWRGAQRDLEVPAGPQLVVDLGGGSTELAMGQEDELLQRASLELGSARLTERFLEADDAGRVPAGAVEPLQAYVDAEVARYSFVPSPELVIGVAGTVTTLAAIQLGLEAYDSVAVHASTLTRDQLGGFVRTLLPMTAEERRAYAHIEPGRADFLLAGCVVLDRVLLAAGVEQLTVSDRGLRFGLLA